MPNPNANTEAARLEIHTSVFNGGLGLGVNFCIIFTLRNVMGVSIYGEDLCRRNEKSTVWYNCKNLISAFSAITIRFPGGALFPM